MKRSFLFSVGTLLLYCFYSIGALEASLREFDELSSIEVKKNHQLLKTFVDDCYQAIETDYSKYFEPGGKWNQQKGFDFKKGVNLAAIGVQWIIRTEKKTFITDFQILKSSQNKNLIASNTSSYQWKPSVLDEKSFHMLAWPSTSKRSFYDFNLMFKFLDTPNILQDIKQPFYARIYQQSLQSVNDFLRDSLKRVDHIVSNKTLFKSLQQKDISLLQRLEEFFPNKRFLFYQKAKPTDYFNGIPNLKRYSEDLQKNALDQEEIDISAIINRQLLEKDQMVFLDSSNESNLSIFSYLLDVYKDKYKSFKSNNNPIDDIKKIYPLDAENEMDIFHSEPLLAWWIDGNLEQNRQNMLKLYSQSLEISDVFPVFFFYTERQTCPSCENIVQKKAYQTRYIPLIAFNEFYSPDYVFLSGTKIPLRETYNYPYSIFSNWQSSSLNFLSLKKLMSIKEPIDIHAGSLQIDYDRFLGREIDFMKDLQETSFKKASKMQQIKESLEKERENYDLNLQKIGDKENPLYQTLLSNQSFQSAMLMWLSQETEEQEVLSKKAASFIETQEGDLKSEKNILESLKNSFQRIPIQYRLTL